MKRSNYIYASLDVLLVSLIFLVFHFFKFDSIIFNGIYLVTFYLYIPIWIIMSIYHGKYRLIRRRQFLPYLKSLVWPSSLTLFVLTAIVSITELQDISRLFLLQISFIPLIPETLIGWLIIRSNKKTVEDIIDIEQSNDRQSLNLQVRWVLMGALTLIAVYFLLIKFKTGEFYLYQWSERILLITFAAWIFSIILTRKYSLIETDNIYYQITPYIKSGLVMLLIAALVYFFFRIEDLSRFLLFGTILVSTGVEIIVFTIIYLTTKHDTTQSVYTKTLDQAAKWDIHEDTFESDIQKYEIEGKIDIKSIFDQISTLDDKEELIEFLNSKLDKLKITFFASSIFSTISIENIEIIRNYSKNLIINLHELNDIRYINEFLITVHSKLTTDGYFVGSALPIETTYNRIKKQMPRLLLSLYYPLHFIFTRMLPKLPRLNNLYFLLTKGQGQTISKAEVFGRLNYCGYKVIANKIINEKLYFIARKIKTKSVIKNPSYHPIVKLNRIGINGDIVQIHKFRTMHPYSEFIQKDIYEENELDISGKFKDDFRITSWGKIMRRFWLDELPQFYDWMQGRLNLVGVRAISEQYFSLYPKSHQEFRIKFKPGIIPPYYVDLPQTLDEIVASERKYLLQKQKSPLKTDLKYGFLAFYNIIFKGARSS